MEFIDFFQKTFGSFMSRIVIAVVIILIGFIIGKILGKLVQGVLHEIELNKILEKINKFHFVFIWVILFKSYYFIYVKLLIIYMVNYEEQIKQLEDEIRNTQYNKATQHHIGLTKAKISVLKDKQLARSKGGKKEGYDVRKTGDGTVIIIGFPSVGKS